MYRSIEDVEKALADRSRAEAVMQRVNKGGKGSFTYIPWNETVRLLDDIFGTFGWSLRVTHTANDFERGIYRTDVELSVYAGEGITKTLAGTGVGVVPASQRENADAHDTAIKASRSDALSVAAKSLGNAFGLFLYDRGDPARTEAPTTNNTYQKQSTQAAPAAKSVGDLGPRPSEKQIGVLTKNGYTNSQIDAMEFKTWKACIDAIFGKGEAPVKPGPKATKAAPVKAPQSQDSLVEELFG